MPATLAWRVEHACLNAWPALRTVVRDGWILRFGHGLTRRSNSVGPLHADARIAGEHLQYFENAFRAQELPLIMRIPSLLDPAVDHELERLGFRHEGECVVLHGAISSDNALADASVFISAAPTEHWLGAMHDLQGHSPEQGATYRAIVGAIALPSAFAVLRENNRIVALAYATLDGDLMCSESVVVNAAERGKGYGRRLMTALLHWGRRNGATGGCLQVVATNEPAIGLYRGLGLSAELYRYHYRRIS